RHTRCLSDWSSDVCSSDLISFRWRRLIERVGSRVPISLKSEGALLVSDFVGRVTGAELLRAAIDVNKIEAGASITPHRIVDLSEIGRAARRERVSVQVGAE